MERYRNLSGNSAISAYNIDIDYIIVRFNTGKLYTYSYRKAGKIHVENMKVLAIKGSGLNSYINSYVKKLYD